MLFVEKVFNKEIGHASAPKQALLIKLEKVF